MWQGWLSIALGAWIAAAPFTSLDIPWSKLNSLLFGAMAVFISGSIPENKFWSSWLGITAGAWVVVSSNFKIFMTGEGYLWSSVISGMVVLIAGILALAGFPNRSYAK